MEYFILLLSLAATINLIESLMEKISDDSRKLQNRINANKIVFVLLWISFYFYITKF